MDSNQKNYMESMMASLLLTLPGPLGLSCCGVVNRPRYVNFTEIAVGGNHQLRYSPLIDSRKGKIHVSGGEVHRSEWDIVTNLSVCACFYQSMLIEPINMKLLSLPSARSDYKARNHDVIEVELEGRRYVCNTKELNMKFYEHSAKTISPRGEFCNLLERWRESIEYGASVDHRLKLPYFRSYSEDKMGFAMNSPKMNALVGLYHIVRKNGWGMHPLPLLRKHETGSRLLGIAGEKLLEDSIPHLEDLFNFSFNYSRVNGSKSCYPILAEQLFGKEPRVSQNAMAQIDYSERAKRRMALIEELGRESNVHGDWLAIRNQHRGYELSEKPDSPQILEEPGFMNQTCVDDDNWDTNIPF